MAEKFQVINSTISPKQLGEVIQQKYALSTGTECALFRAAMNHLYIVKDGEQQFVFRVYTINWRTRQEIGEELRLLSHLKTKNASVAYPIADTSNNFIQEIEAPEGKRYGVLFSYAKGTKIPRFSPEVSFHGGKALARMHRLTGGFVLDRTNYDSKTLLEDSILRLKAFFKEPLEEIRFLETLAGFLKTKFEGADIPDLRKGAVHLDVWFDNFHIQDNNEVTFFDFDFCGNGWLCLDISYFLFQLFTTNMNEADYQLKADSFLKGYESEIEITQEEKNMLPYACLAIMVYYISVQCDRYDYWTNIFVTEDHLKRYVGNLKRWIQFHGLEVE